MLERHEDDFVKVVLNFCVKDANSVFQKFETTSKNSSILHRFHDESYLNHRILVKN